MSQTNNNPFSSHPAFSGLSPEKLEFLMNFANAKKPSQMQELLPFLMSSLQQAKRNHIDFTPSESDLLIEVLKQGLSPADAKKADMILKLMGRNHT